MADGFVSKWLHRLKSSVRGTAPLLSLPLDLPVPDPKAFAIKEVLAREVQQVRSLSASRNVRDHLNPAWVPGQPKNPDALAPEQFGVCFSGGGIRSASVNLGVIQSLAKAGFLRQVHYLSGVSGGGYILGWLTGWIARVGFDSVEAQLSTDSAWPHNMLPERPGFRRYLEPNAIHYLRRYVSFLVPRTGLGSGDTLAAAAIYLRNVLLVQAPVWTALTAIFAFVQIFAPAIVWPLLASSWNGWVGWAALIALLLALAVCVWIPLDLLARNICPKKRQKWATWARVLGVAVCAWTWLLIPAYINAHPAGRFRLVFPAAAVFVFFLLEELVVAIATRRAHGPEFLQSVEPQYALSSSVLAALGAAAMAALLLSGFGNWMHAGSSGLVSDAYVILGLPALLFAASLLSFCYIGLFGDSFPDAKREWLGRLAGYYLYFGAIIGTILFLALLGPLCMQWLFNPQHASWKNQILKWVLPGGWIATTVAGLFAARSPKTGDGDSSTTKELLAAIAPPVFLLGLMLLTSWGTHKFAIHFGAPEYLASGQVVTDKPAAACPVCGKIEPPEQHFVLKHASLQPPFTTEAAHILLLLGLVSALGSLVLGFRVTVNEFSLHLFYRSAHVPWCVQHGPAPRHL
jgi:hypothetical protein